MIVFKAKLCNHDICFIKFKKSPVQFSIDTQWETVPEVAYIYVLAVMPNENIYFKWKYSLIVTH